MASPQPSLRGWLGFSVATFGAGLLVLALGTPWWTIRGLLLWDATLLDLRPFQPSSAVGIGVGLAALGAAGFAWICVTLLVADRRGVEGAWVASLVTAAAGGLCAFAAAFIAFGYPQSIEPADGVDIDFTGSELDEEGYLYWGPATGWWAVLAGGVSLIFGRLLMIETDGSRRAR